MSYIDSQSVWSTLKFVCIHFNIHADLFYTVLEWIEWTENLTNSKWASNPNWKPNELKCQLTKWASNPNFSREENLFYAAHQSYIFHIHCFLIALHETKLALSINYPCFFSFTRASKTERKCGSSATLNHMLCSYSFPPHFPMCITHRPYVSVVCV